MKYHNTFFAIQLFSLAIVSSSIPAHVSASGFSINEVMYDLKEGSDSGREWIEVLNTGSTALDLSTFKLYESGTAHAIKSSQGSASIPAGAYGVIADTPDKFLADNPGFSGNLFDSTFSLVNTGETISLKDSTNAVVDSLTYSSTQGGAGDGSTLGKIGDAFVSTNPTPGFANTLFTGAAAETSVTSTTSSASDSGTQQSDISADGSESSSDTSVSDGSASTISTTSYPSGLVSVGDDSAFKVGAGRDRLVTVHSPVLFSALSSGSAADRNIQTTYEWSFGDGVQAYGKSVEHAYMYPGQYNVVLVAGNIQGTRVTSRAKIFVRQGSVSISGNLIGQNGYVTLSNLSKEEINIGGWGIGVFDGHIHTNTTVPTDTILSPQNTLRFSYAWPDTNPADVHAMKKGIGQGATDTVSIPQEIDLAYPDGTLATSTGKVRLDVSAMRDILAALQEQVAHQLSLAASSTLR